MDTDTPNIPSQRKGSTSLSSDLGKGEEDIKEKLEWYFKTPYRKYKERGKKPYKFLLQIAKIILVTIQATLFATDEFSIVTFEGDNLRTFRNLFIPAFDGSTVKILYTKETVYHHMFYAWKQYYMFEDSTIGSYNVVRTNSSLQPINFCKTWYIKVRDIVENDEATSMSSNISDSQKDEHCFYMKPPMKPINETSLEEFVVMNSLPPRIGWISSMQMKFLFRLNNSIYHSLNSIDCCTFDNSLDFNNEDLDGTMALSLTTTVKFYPCQKLPHTVDIAAGHKSEQTVLSVIIILICIISTCLCLRSFKMHYLIYKDAARFFSEYRHEKFTMSDKVVFVSFWYGLIVLADFCAICGCVLKIFIDLLEHPELYAMCSICFGLAVLFSWIGILRYLGFLKDYNILLLTLKIAFPHILRFICCVSFIYMGFLLCGWIVLGPYHDKFANIILSSECLFSLLNGDDMFNTYILVYDRTTDPAIIYFSKVYLYIFISLFMFVVLSLFIGIVEDTFDEISEIGSAPKTRLELFMEGTEYTEADGATTING